MKKILTAFSIASISYLSAVELTLDKPDYTTTDTIKINFSEMDNHHKDWIAIYPKGSSTAWKNVVKWAWTYNKSEGTFTFKNLPAGEYEARAFFNNSYEVETTKTFKVKGSGVKAELRPTKPIFTYREDVRINFKNINGATNDWIGIYPEGKSNYFGNVVKWKYNKDGVKSGQMNFDKLPVGKYEARIFYNNSFRIEGKIAFEVEKTVAKAELTPTKTVFTTTEDVRINFKNINGATNDWIGLYPNFIATNNLEEVIKRKFNKGGVKAGQMNFGKLRIGEYEARVFYNNSFKLEGKVYFKVNPDVNDYDERFYTEDRRYSFAYLRTTDLLGLSIARWYVLDNKNTIVDESAGKYNLHFNKIDGVDLFTISQTQTGTTTFYRINSGKLIRLNLEFPAGEPKSVNVIKKGGKTILEMHYYETYTYRYDVTDLANVKLLTDNTGIDNKILKLAKEHCLGKNENSDKVLCTNYKNIVYVIKSEPKLWQTINTIYKVDITPNKEKIDTLKPYIQENYAGLRFDTTNDTHIFKNSSLFKVIDNTVIAEASGKVVILNDKGKKILSAIYAEDSSIFPSFETTDNGNKLIVISGDNPYYVTPGIQTTAIYDISNPNEAVLLSKKEKTVK